MPTSKHRKKHKVKVKQRRNNIAQQKNAYNKQLQQYEDQVAKINEQYKEHIAAGGKPEDFNPLKQLLGNLPLAEETAENDTPADFEGNSSGPEFEDAVEVNESNNED